MRHLLDMQVFRERLRQAVKAHCKEHGVTQEELATQMGMDRNRFRNYFTRATHVPIDQLVKIADHMELDLNWLCGREVSKEWPKSDPILSLHEKLDKALKKKD